MPTQNYSQLKIITHPNSVLRKISSQVSEDELHSVDFQELIGVMGRIMLQYGGVGLAAPQVGVSKRLLVVNVAEGQVVAFINPKIIKKSLRKNILEEGCLSIPGVFGNVKRPKNIKVKYQDLKGNWHKLKCDDYLSRVLQHEIDHLDGILFIDKLRKK